LLLVVIGHFAAKSCAFFLEKALINLLNVKNLFVATSDIVADHQFGKLRTIYKNDPRTDVFGALMCRSGEPRRRNKYSLGGFADAKSAVEIANVLYLRP
jgi:hypothetical protein